MDVKTHALDRVLEALTPALAAELERVAQEARETADREFEMRVQSAIREAEAAAASAARAELDRTVAQVKEDTRREVTAELEQRFNERLEASTVELKAEAGAERARFEEAMAELKNEWSGELNKVEDDLQRWRTYAEAQRQLGEASSQSEMLARFLSLGEPFAQGLAVYVSKADGLALWQSKGKGAFPKIISRETTDPETFFKNITVRGKTVGAICAAPAFQAEPLEFLAGSLEYAIEAFGLKLRTSAVK